MAQHVDPDPTMLSHLAAALSSVTSPDAGLRTRATEYLSAAQTSQHGFLVLLIRIVADRGSGYGDEVRTQASVFFKNSLDKCWSTRQGPSVLDAADKAAIRQTLLALLDEHDRAIAKTLAFCVGKLARWEYPSQWPDLFSNLHDTLGQSTATLTSEPGNTHARLIIHRSLMYYQQAVKKLSENRMLKGKEIIGRLAEEATPPLLQLYTTLKSFVISSFQSAPSLASPQAHPQASPHSELVLCVLVLKILTRLTVYGWKGHVSSADGREQILALQKQFFDSSIDDLVQLVELRKQVVGASQPQQGEQVPTEARVAMENFNKLIKNIGKLHRMLLMQNHHVFHDLGQDMRLIQVSWQFVHEACTNLPAYVSDDPFAYYPHAFVVQHLLLIKSLFTQSPTASPDLSSPEFAKTCVETIVSKILPLTQAELEKWHEDPEEWIRVDEEENNWQFDLRPCAHTFLDELVQRYTEQVVPLLKQFLDSTAHPRDFNEILYKEAVYTAVGRSSSHLSSIISFPSWLSERLIPEALSTEPEWLIVRRRIAWLVGYWVTEAASTPAAQTAVYQLLSHLLACSPVNEAGEGKKVNGNDLAVRLTAAKSIGQCDNWEFDAQLFLPFLEATLRDLAALLEEANLPETHRKIADVLGLVIQRVGQAISPHLNLLMDILPRLWTSAQEDQNFQMSIIVTLRKLVEALEKDSQVLHGPICQFIQLSCDPQSPSHGILQDDGLELWQSTLKFSTAPTAELMSLAPLSISLLSSGSDLLPRVLRIIEQYILLSPADFLSLRNLVQIVGQLNDQLNSLSEKAVKMILYTMDLCVQAGGVQVWVQALEQTGLFTSLVGKIYSEPHESANTRYLYSIARIAATSGEAFNHLLAASSGSLGLPHDQLLDKILQQWTDRYDNQTYSGQRKMLAVGLSSVVQTTNPVVFSYMGDIMGVWLSALSETAENEHGESVHSPLSSCASHSASYQGGIGFVNGSSGSSRSGSGTGRQGQIWDRKHKVWVSRSSGVVQSPTSATASSGTLIARFGRGGRSGSLSSTGWGGIDGQPNTPETAHQEWSGASAWSPNTSSEAQTIQFQKEADASETAMEGMEELDELEETYPRKYSWTFSDDESAPRGSQDSYYTSSSAASSASRPISPYPVPGTPVSATAWSTRSRFPSASPRLGLRVASALKQSPHIEVTWPSGNAPCDAWSLPPETAAAVGEAQSTWPTYMKSQDSPTDFASLSKYVPNVDSVHPQTSSFPSVDMCGNSGNSPSTWDLFSSFNTQPLDGDYDDSNDNSAEGYYDNDEQPESFELGWGEGVTGDPGVQRLHQLVRSDPVHSRKLSHTISHGLGTAQAMNGGEASFAQIGLKEVDPAVLNEFMAYLSGQAQGGD